MVVSFATYSEQCSDEMIAGNKTFFQILFKNNYCKEYSFKRYNKKKKNRQRLIKMTPDFITLTFRFRFALTATKETA